MKQVCAEMRLLVQADVDGELAAGESARVGVHLDACPDCAALHERLAGLSVDLRKAAPHFAASDALRSLIQARVGGSTAAPVPVPEWRLSSRLPWWRRLPRPALWSAAPFGAGAVLAAWLMVALVLPPAPGLPDEVVAGHIRALQPGHLMDVVSTDQHTVKPWFDGRLDFAPPVKDLQAEGFPLVGGRLDYLDARPVAALVYLRRQHAINLFVWPGGGHTGPSPIESNRSGYNVVRWNRDGMEFWAVSDLGAGELAEFANRWQGR